MRRGGRRGECMPGAWVMPRILALCHTVRQARRAAIPSGNAVAGESRSLTTENSRNSESPNRNGDKKRNYALSSFPYPLITTTPLETPNPEK